MKRAKKKRKIFKRKSFVPPGFGVDIKNNLPKYTIAVNALKRLVKAVLEKEDVYQARLTILLVSDAQIQRLNRRFLSRNTPTDVLAFDLRPQGVKTKALIGDIVISVERAKAVSTDLKINFFEELARYLIHGVLHLTGYDDSSNAEKIKMWRRQEELLKKLLFKRR